MFLKDFLQAEPKRSQRRNAFFLNLCVPCPSAWKFFQTSSFSQKRKPAHKNEAGFYYANFNPYLKMFS
jgi:hypothetical protein